MSSSRKRLTWALALGVAVTGIVAPAASANTEGTGLVISEVYVNGGSAGASYTHKFVELYNPGDTPVDLSTMSVQYRSGTGTGTGTAVPLVGSIPAKGYFVVQGGTNGTNGAAVPAPNQISTINPGGGGGTLFLASTTAAVDPDPADAGGAVVDLVGWGTSTTFETAAASGNSVTASLQRQTVAGVANKDTDNNAADLLASLPTPGAVYTPPPPPENRTIAEIQGAGPVSPENGKSVITRGVVTAAYPSGGFFGYYLQTPGTGGALDLASHTASDGVFVYQPTGTVAVSPGQYVEVTGAVSEYAGQTQLRVAAADVTVLPDVVAPVAPVVTEWPDAEAEKESLEGMLYTPSGDFTVTNTYSTNQYGEVGLARGNKPLIQPTQVADAQDAAAIAAVTADNLARSIVLDDASSTNYTASSTSTTVCGTRPVPCLTNGSLTPPYISNDEPVRVGAKASFDADVIFTQGGSTSAPTYRFEPLAPVTGPDNATSPVAFENTRTDAPDLTRINARGTSDIKVASFNVLNYFTTLGDLNDDNVADGTCTAYTDRDGDGVTVNTACDSRGAWDPEDLQRQQSKIVKAINALDADVVGLMEIENSLKLGEEPDEATKSLVAALNADAGSQVWAANPSSADLPVAAEMDVISNAIIYKVAKVDRVGEAHALGSLSGAGEAFDNAREPIAQAFSPKGGGSAILLAVNHLKSKGSGDDDGTGQGNANPDRIAQATALRDWIPTVQAATGVQAVLLAGDFNSYAMEDPVQVLYAAGYANVEQEFGNDEYSYSFSGLSGSLDHVLANSAAMELTTGADIWNINSGEALALEYSRFNYHSTDFHAPTPFRSSDHDPVVVGLDLVPRIPDPDPVQVPTVEATASGLVYGTAGAVSVTVSGDTAVPTGTVTVLEGTTELGSATLSEGAADVALGARSLTPGTHELTVSYAGDAATEAKSITLTVKVAKATSSTTAKVRQQKVKEDRTRAVLDVTVRASGVVPTGKVQVRVAGQRVRTVTLRNGKVTLTLGTFARPGQKRVTVTYLGDRFTLGSERTFFIRVLRK